MNVTRRYMTLATAATLLGGLALTGPAGASINHPTVVTDNPANFTPNVIDDAAVPESSVDALFQLGTTMYAGGAFRTVQNSTRTTNYTRNNLMSFNATTGAMNSFAPNVNGKVFALAGDGTSLYVGGYFNQVNGVARRGLAKINATTGAVDTAFNANLNGNVQEIRLVNGRLIVGGSFGQRLLALNPVTGANTGYINVNIAGTVAANAGSTDVYRFAVNPQGTRLVAIGNFTTVNGSTRSRAFMLDLGATSASLSSWYYQPLVNMCQASRLPAYMRDVDFSPDGSYFVFVSTGFVPRPGGLNRDLCDAVARFETTTLNPSSPTWINYSGGDTYHSVAATGSAIYAQGHIREMNDPSWPTSSQAVARQGIGAINPSTGVALSWNPGKTRGVGGKELYATSAGLWVGSDTPRFAGEFRSDLAFLPLS